MKVEKLFELIPSSVLEELALETAVDYYAKKLQGELLFKLLVYCIITYKDNSLRTMQSAYESLAFQLLHPHHRAPSVSISSISERLATIPVAYFEQLFERCVALYQQLIPQQETLKIKRFDSTIVSLSAHLLHTGYRLSGDAQNRSQLKFTLGYSDIPEVVCLFTDLRYTSENAALGETMLEQEGTAEPPDSVFVFDKGVTSRDIYDELSERHIPFVSRLNPQAKRQWICPHAGPLPLKTPSLEIRSDGWYYLFGQHAEKTSHPVRLLEAIHLDSGEAWMFVTNIADLEPLDVTELYKRRWDVEVFIKFIKQFLSFAHLVNRSENGIQVMLYATMTAAILLQAYKKTNGLSGFKLVRQKFSQQLEMEIVKHLVVLCGGNPQKLNKLLYCNSS